MKQTTQGKTFTLNATALKTIAVIAMVIDHATWAFVDSHTLLAAGLHAVGRLTGPIMFYFIAVGYYHTHDLKKYAARLGIFALISHLPYNYFINYGAFSSVAETSVIFTLLCGLLALAAYDRIENPIVKTFSIIALCLLTARADWGIVGVLFILLFGIYHNNRNKQLLAYAYMSTAFIALRIVDAIANALSVFSFLYTFGMFLAIPVLKLYNGERGGNKFTKWMFYIIYPLQFAVIGLIWLWMR